MSTTAEEISWKRSAGFLNARSSLVVIVALVFCFTLVIVLNHFEPGVSTEVLSPETSNDIPSPRVGDWGQADQDAAVIAWKYFQNNYQEKTGLVNSADKFPAATMWDTGSYLMALISARQLDILTPNEFDAQLSKALGSLAQLPLFEGKLPNKSYNIISLKMADYNNNVTARGIGWSPIDIGRLLISFNIITWHYPQHTSEVRKILAGWNVGALAKDGQLFGSAIGADGKTGYVQEGRLGYEEYSAKSFSLLGLDVNTAQHYQSFLRYVDIYNQKVPTDRRDPSQFQAHNYVVSEPYILDGLEFGWDHFSREFAYRVYRAQEERFLHTHKLTAVSEDNLDQAPYFVYNTVFTDGKTWSAITDKGEDASRFKSLSTKAVFGWYALYRTDYTDKLRQAIQEASNPEKGWYAGIYDETGKPNRALTANTNAIILESLCFRKFGQLVRVN